MLPLSDWQTCLPVLWTAVTRHRLPPGRHVSPSPSAVMPAHSKQKSLAQRQIFSLSKLHHELATRSAALVV